MQSLIQRSLITLSILTAFGVLVHDMKLDRVAMTALALPVVIASFEGSSRLALFTNDAHTHVERTSLSEALSDLKTPSPRIQPRAADDRKHLQQRVVARGSQLFDSYHLPLA